MDILKNSKKEILVCIPVYNGGDALEKTLHSVFSQTHESFDVLVLDNKSTDNTAEIVHRFQKEDRLHFIVNDKNLGRIGNWNQCLELFQQSPHEYLKFVFAGDILKKHCLKILVRALNEHPRAGFVVAEYEIIYPERGILEKHSFSKKEVISSFQALLRFLIRNWVGAPISFMLRKDALGERRFLETLQWSADWKFSIDIVNQSPSIYVPEIIGSLDIRQRKHYQKLYGSSLMIKEEIYLRAYCIMKILKKIIR